MIGIAYAATIGGMSTLVGTAPNIVFSAFMYETYGVEISMIDWMTLGVPLAAIMLFFAWVILTKYIFQLLSSHLAKPKVHLKDMINDLGPLSKMKLKYQLFLV